MTIFSAQLHAVPHDLTDESLDAYGRRGAALSRDAVSVVIAALRRDADEMRRRGGEPNLEGAELEERLARALLDAVAGR